jgi:hypothetical protein
LVEEDGVSALGSEAGLATAGLVEEDGVSALGSEAGLATVMFVTIGALVPAGGVDRLRSDAKRFGAARKGLACCGLRAARIRASGEEAAVTLRCCTTRISVSVADQWQRRVGSCLCRREGFGPSGGRMGGVAPIRVRTKRQEGRGAGDSVRLCEGRKL